MPITDPIQGITTPSGIELPDGSAAFADLANELVVKSVMNFSTTADRDTKIATGDREAGMFAWIDALGCWTGVLADDGPWKLIAGRPMYWAEQTLGFTWTTSYTDVPNCGLTLPAGQWFVTGTGYIDYSTAAAQTYFMQINDGTGATFTSSKIGLVARVPFSVQHRCDLATSTTVKLQAYVGATDGSQGLSNGRISAIPVLW